MTLILVLAGYLIAISSLTFVAFGIDKSRASRQQFRIPERLLLLLSFFGGWFGAKLAQRWFRHKTRKQPFARHLNCIPILWVLAVFSAFALISMLSKTPSPGTDEFTRQIPRLFQSAGH